MMQFVNTGDETTDSGHLIGASLESFLTRQGLRRVNTLATVVEHWDELVGAELAAHAKPTVIRDGELVISVDHPAWATELKFHVHRIVEDLKKYLGTGIITGVKVHVRP